MSAIRWDLRIDWNNDGSFSAGTPTGAQATAAGNAITPNYLVTSDADAADVAVGAKVMLYLSGGVTLKQDYVFTVTSKQSASGFTNIFVDPSFATGTLTNEVLKVVTPTGEDVTPRALNDSPIQLQYGRDTGRAQSPVSPGQATFTLNNSSKDYSPNNVSSPIVGNLYPGRRCYLKGTHLATTYTLFDGFLNDYQPNPQEQSVGFTAMDLLARFSGVTMSTPLYEGIRGGEAIGYILDAIGWTGGRDLDVGGTIFPYWWEEGTDAYDALIKVLQSEGPPSIAYVGANGSFTFRDRHHRLTRAASTTSQATFKDSGQDTTGSVMFSAPFGFDAGWRDVVNLARFAVQERFPDSAPSYVWEDESVIIMGPSESELIDVETPEPFKNARAPVEGDDFELISGSVVTGLSRTSGQATQIGFIAGAGGARIQNLKLRATSVQVVRTRQTATEDATSQGLFGIRSWPDDAPWAGVHDAKAVANVIINLRRLKREIVSVTLDGGDSDVVLTQQLDRDLSDRVTVVETETATNAAFFVERIEHEISEAGGRLTTTVHCERAPTTLDDPATVFVLGTSVIGTGVLAR